MTGPARVAAAEQPVVLITGGSSGIGRASALRLAGDGYRVAVLDLDVEAGARTVAKIREAGGLATFHLTDVADREQVHASVAEAAGPAGHIAGLVTCAGIQQAADVTHADGQDWDRILGVNLKGGGFAVAGLLHNWTGHHRGAIVTISSVNALLGEPRMAIYDASKAGVLALTRALAMEHGRHGVRVNAVCPGATVTEFHEARAARSGVGPRELRAGLAGYGLLGRAAEPAEIAGVIAFLIGPDSSNITGQAIVADGGWTLSPTITRPAEAVTGA
jgi:2-hydroxycyclohexanecarboxyl-CoA dehydrogenase